MAAPLELEAVAGCTKVVLAVLCAVLGDVEVLSNELDGWLLLQFFRILTGGPFWPLGGVA